MLGKHPSSSLGVALKPFQSWRSQKRELMRRSSFRVFEATLCGGAGLFWTQLVLAQESPAAPVTEVSAPAPPELAAESPAATEKPAWFEALSVGVFVDVYGALTSENNDTKTTPAHRSYVRNNGFQLSFAGVDVAYSGEQFGATVSVRFGPSVPVFYAADMGPFGIDNVLQAYLTYKPIDKLTFDLGQFGTIYGAEVAESFRNKNYSRGALYYAFQPFWHTGLRANYAVNDVVGFNAMLVNGVNTPIEGNALPSVGVQTVLAPLDGLSIAIGYLGALKPRGGDEGPVDVDGDGSPDVENKFEHFFDVVANANAGDFSLTFNADFDLYRLKGVEDGENFWGVSIAPGYAFTDFVAAALRLEYLADSANAQLAIPGAAAGDSSGLLTFTATLDIKPVPGSRAVVLRPEFVYEKSSDDNYNNRDNEPTDGYWQAVLGAVVTSM
jgi:hypothetical protein